MRAVVACLVLIAGLGFVRVGGGGVSSRSVEQQEKLRLEAHFDSVIAELRSARVDHLSISQQQARSTLIHWLREYRDGGRFPRNDRFAIPTPYFRDASGTLCAMAYLIARSGRTDIVDRIASTANNAHIDDIRDDAELAQWADSVGLMLYEAARVQPSYGSPNPDHLAYGIASGAVTTLALVSAGFNVFEPSRTSGWWGVVAGGAAIAMGLPFVGSPKSTGGMAKANVAFGAGALALSLRGFMHKDSDTAPAEAQTSGPSRSRHVTVAPLVVPGGRRAAIGVGVGVNF